MSSPLLDITSVSIRGRARAPRDLKYHVVRELTPADIALLQADRKSTVPAIKKLRDSHHRIARCFAAGMTDLQVSMQTGYSFSRLSILRTDNSFKDLIETYRKAGVEAFAEYSDIAMGNMVKGERLIEDSLESVGEREAPLELGELRPVLEIVADRADRFGYPRKSTNVNLNLDFAGKLESARRRSGLNLPSSQEQPPDKEPTVE